MSKRPLLSRRQFLIGAATALGGAALAGAHRLLETPAIHAQDPTLTPWAYLPYVARSDPGGAPPRFRVVHVHAGTATHWTGSYTQIDYRQIEL